MSEKKVIIVGGGNAGLAAAYELHKAGIPYTVLEATNHYGGRLTTNTKGDFRFHEGAVFTEPQWTTTHDYLREFGLSDRVYTPEKKIYGLYLKGETVYFEDTGNLFESLLQLKGLPPALLIQGAKFIPNLLKAMAAVGENHDFSKLKDISEMSTREWVEKHGGPEVADKLLGPMLETMTLSRSSDICAAHPIALMKLMKGMDQVDGGLEIVNDAIYEIVKDNIRLSTPVKEIVVEDDAIKGVQLVDGEFIETDEVICCTDAVDAISLIPGLPQAVVDDLSTCTYCRTFHYVYYMEDQFVPDGFMAQFIPESEDSILSTFFAGRLNPEYDRVEGVPQEHAFGPTSTWVRAFTAGWHDDELIPLSDEERNARVTAEIDKFAPGFAEKAELVFVRRLERAINQEPPGQFNAINDLKENHIDDVKGLYYAGEYMFLIACTEGAWMTGKQAAEKLIASR